MRLVSIELSDVRRFVAPVRIDGIGPGLNVLSAPNEFGKSTLFDALQALFFQPHRSRGKEIMALKPHVGGAPAVTVEVDLPEGRHRIEKRWLSRPQATVHRDGRLIAQADEAEAFIARLVQSDSAGGPAGLLWVRQGLTGLDGDRPAEREAAKLARRSLMTSVTGEVESLTGGRRMDRALSRTREELGTYLSAKGRAAKSSGPLALAEAEVDDLSTRKAALQAIADRLDLALTRRREVLRDLADLTAPDAVTARQTRLDEATQRVQAAQRHAENLTVARKTLDSAELSHRVLSDQLAALRRARDDRDRAAMDLAGAQRKAAEAQVAQAAAAQALAPLAETLTTARTAQAAADALWREALRAEQMRAATARRADLTARLAQGRALLETRAPLAPAAATGPQAKDMTQLETLWQDVQVQRALRDRSAPQIAFHHDGPARVTRDGQPVGADALPLLSAARFDMPGLGHFTVTPGAAADHAALDRAEAAFAQMLARLGLPDLATARHAATARTQAEAALRDLDRDLKTMAPDGLSALEAELAALPAEAPPRADLPPATEAQAAAEAARDALTRADAAHGAARTEADRLSQTEVRATVLAEAAAETLRQAEAALARLDPAQTAEADLGARLSAAGPACDDARAALARLTETAPDLDTAKAAFQRARSVVERAAEDTRRLEAERAALDAEVNLRSGEGVMEDLADIALRLTAAAAKLDHIRFEVSVLQALAQTLEAARDEARDRYFEPVLAELRPLLRLLWPDAELRFDGESLLPTALVRNGQDEDLSILSGGTQEQIALLVRLAFARLLARRGQHAPVIFDDALVFTDDDRIEKMFDALHAQAQDQQIIVLSCRQRAFRDLGGAALTMRAV